MSSWGLQAKGHRVSDDEQPTSEKPVTPLARFASQISQDFGAISAGLAKHIAESIAPFSSISLFPRLNMTGALGISETLEGFAAGLFEQHRQQWADLFSSLKVMVETVLPPNWKGVRIPDFETIEMILLYEGIPLAWVPGPQILQAILDAPDATARRLIISRRWKRLVSDCEASIGEVSHPGLLDHQSYAMDVVRALRDGHTSAAQALAANLLDSVLRRQIDKDEFKVVTRNRKNEDPLDMDDYRIRAALTFAPVWRAYAEYWESGGDPIPRTFGRHPSAHAVSRTQYSRINAVIGLMLVTSLLRLVDSEPSE